MATKKKATDNPTNGTDVLDEPIVQTPKIEVSAEEQKNALATIKPADLQHLTSLQKEIEGYRNDYSGLTIEDENDNEGYEKVRLALGVLRPKRTGLDAERKSVTRPYAETVKYINSMYNGVINTIAEIEAPLKGRKKEIDEIEENKKEQERLQQEQKVNDRINELINNNCVFDGSYYSIGSQELLIPETSVGVVDIRTMSDELYKNILQTVIDKSAKIKAEQARIQKEKDDAEKLRIENETKEREAFALQQAEFKKQQDEFKAQQELLNKQKEEIEKQKQEEENKKDEERKKERNLKIDQRRIQLNALGMTYNYQDNTYAFKDVSVDDKTEICLLPTEEWDALVEKITPVIAERKLAIKQKEEEERKAEEKRIAEAAIEQENERKRLLKIKQDEEMASANDKTKYDFLISQLKAIEIPDMKSPKYRNLTNPIRDFIADL